MVPNLAEFIDRLSRSGQLRRIACEVDAELEIAAITRRVAHEAGPALMFENVRGHRTPVVTNLLGTEDRIRLAIGITNLEDAAKPNAEATGGWLDKLRGKGSEETSQPNLVRAAPCQQVVKLGRDVDLAEWPALRLWPAETASSITAGVLVTGDQMQSAAAVVLDRARLGIANATHVTERTPVALVLGGEPALSVVASPAARLLAGFDLASQWRKRGPDMVRCRTHDLLVPAEAEIVIEGFLEPTAMPAPPLSDETGYYAAATSLHAMEVTAVTHRTNPMFPAVVVSAPPNETSVVRGAIARWLRPMIEQAVPELVDYNLVTSAASGQFTVLSIRKQYAGQCRKVLAACWGAEVLMATKFVVVVDEGVNVTDVAAVLRAMGTHADPERDTIVWQGPTTVGNTQSASTVTRLGTSHLGIDATTKLPGEGAATSPLPLLDDPAMAELVAGRWKEYGL